MDFDQTKSETHDKLIDRLDDLELGGDVSALASFARAYLGMYLDLDSHLEPEARVALLADDDVIDSIWAGFHTWLHEKELPDIDTIAASIIEDKRVDACYIGLAAIDRQYRQTESIDSLDDERLQRLICANYVYRHELDNSWLPQLIDQRPQLVADALLALWRALGAQGSSSMPGFRHILTHQEQHHDVLCCLVLPVLREFDSMHKWLMKQLLLFAFQNCPLDRLAEVCHQRMADADALPINKHVYWLGAAYLLAPDEFEQQLHDYTGRTREKALPLLNFIVPVMQLGREELVINADMIASLLQAIAPRFRPDPDRFGQLDDNVQKIVWMFDQLHECPRDEAKAALEKLRDIRVMKLYSDYLNKIERVLEQS